jgi:hypothetical protein
MDPAVGLCAVCSSRRIGSRRHPLTGWRIRRLPADSDARRPDQMALANFYRLGAEPEPEAGAP